MPDAITLRQADSLYQGFPDFSAWPAPTEDDLRLWDRFAARLEETRQKATPETLKKALDVAVRAAAVDTGAIEGLYSVDRGFTMTVATQALAWEHAIEEKGENVRALFEAQLEAYELVLDAVTKRLPISEAWIRALHETVCAGQQTYRVFTDQGWQEQELLRGAYKTQPNHVRLSDGSMHPYAPVDRVASEMHRLLEQIRTPEFEIAHPIAQASYLHYGFVVIHPFADGNGRMARALASVFFYRALSIPFLVFANQRSDYLSGLRQADSGNLQLLLKFFRDRGIDTILLVVEHLLKAETPTPEEVVSRMHEPPKSPKPQRVDDVALRLAWEVKDSIDSCIKDLRLPEHLSLSFNRSISVQPAPSGYRQVDWGSPSVRIDLWDRSKEGVRAIQFRVLIALDNSDPFPFLVQASDGGDGLEVRMEDAYPEISTNLRFRLSSWILRQLSRFLEDWDKWRHPTTD